MEAAGEADGGVVEVEPEKVGLGVQFVLFFFFLLLLLLR